MSATTIEWTQRPGTKGETWNPTTGCNKVSQGCKHCYAETMHKRLRAMHQPKYQHHFLGGVFTHPDTLTIPLQWKKPRTVFVNSMSDLFHADVPFAFIDQVFAIMALTPQHTYQILTKRPERMAEYFERIGTRRKEVFDKTSDGSTRADAQFHTSFLVMMEAIAIGWKGNIFPWPLPNVWLGTSVEDRRVLDRIDHLRRCPAVVRFISFEPLLGSVKGANLTGIHWAITGMESGHHARPGHPVWAGEVRDMCAVERIAYFHKQNGEFTTDINTGLHECDGKYIRGMWYVNLDGTHDTLTIASDGRDFPSPTNERWGWEPCAGPRDQVKPGAVFVQKVGKHESGNLLDGRTHLAYPEVVTLSLPKGAPTATPQPA